MILGDLHCYYQHIYFYQWAAPSELSLVISTNDKLRNAGMLFAHSRTLSGEKRTITQIKHETWHVVLWFVTTDNFSACICMHEDSVTTVTKMSEKGFFLTLFNDQI